MTPSKTPSFSVRIYYEDTDAGGVVYNANYVKFAERARTEWMRELGYSQTDLLTEFGILLAIRHITVDYRAPGRLGGMRE